MHLPDTLWAYRNLPKLAIGFLPFSLVYRIEVMSPTEVMTPSLRVRCRRRKKKKGLQKGKIPDLSQTDMSHYQVHKIQPITKYHVLLLGFAITTQKPTEICEVLCKKSNHTSARVSDDTSSPACVSDDTSNPARVSDDTSNPARVSNDTSSPARVSDDIGGPIRL